MSVEDRMRAMMAGYRREIAPSTDDRTRVWARLDAPERHDAEPTSRPRGVVIGMLVALAAAVIVLLASRFVDDRSAQMRQPQKHQSDYEADRSEPMPAVLAEPPVATLPPTPTASASVEGQLPQERASPRVQRPTVHPVAIPSEDPLRAELRVIESAREALERGDHEATLVRISEYRRRFPDGELVLEARSLRALALCGAGRWVQGRGEARSLLREDPTSPYRDRLRERCDVQ